MSYLIQQALVAALLTWTTGASASDTSQGQQLHEEHCAGCHRNMTGGEARALYTRSDRRVRSLAQLRERVRYCQGELELGWSADRAEAVVDYLNSHYYGF